MAGSCAIFISAADFRFWDNSPNLGLFRDYIVSLQIGYYTSTQSRWHISLSLIYSTVRY